MTDFVLVETDAVQDLVEKGCEVYIETWFARTRVTVPRLACWVRRFGIPATFHCRADHYETYVALRKFVDQERIEETLEKCRRLEHLFTLDYAVMGDGTKK